MNGRCFLFCLLAFCFPACVLAQGEVWVDQSAKTGGDGSANAPFQTLGQALKTAASGSIITVRAGVYRESVRLMRGGSPQNPTTLRAAGGERVVLSGYREIAGWKIHSPASNLNIYTTIVEHPVRDLYVGYRPQQVARADGPQRHWLPLESADAATATVTIGQALRDVAGIESIAQDPSDLLTFHHYKSNNRAYIDNVTEVDLEHGRLTLEGPRVSSMGGDDVLTLINHPALIDRPGEWARKKLDGNRTQVYFWPRDTSDLTQTQSRHNTKAMLTVGHWSERTSHIKIHGIEVTGSLGSGIEVNRTDGVEISGCVVHNNANLGIQTRNSSNARIAGNLVFGNLNGVVVISTPDAVIEENEVCFNYADGIDVVGDVSQKGKEPNSDNAVIRRNYMHHHFLLEHPDNLQFYFGTDNVTIEDNLSLLAFQGMMSQDVDGGTMNNNIFFGASAMVLIFGHNTSNDWTVQNNTLGLGGWGTILMIGSDYQIDHNTFYNNRHGGGDTYRGDYNLLWNTDPDRPVLTTGKPGYKNFHTVAEFTQATGKEAHSKRADPRLANVPAAQAVVTDYEKATPELLYLRQPVGKPTDGFAVGDTIEINGDGVARQLTEVTAEAIRFAPPLPEAPFRSPLVWNWGDKQDMTLDFTPAPGSPAHDMGADGSIVGASIDVRAYMAGDFDGDGERDLPDLADDIKLAIPNPNAPAIPATLP